MLPFLIVWSALVAAYAVIPNRTVRLRDAMIGALIAAVLFESAKRGFALYATSYANYQQVYGALAMVPVFILWIYLSWAIVMFGASITASLSSFDYRPAALRLPREQEFAGLLRVLANFTAAQRAGRGLHSGDLLKAEPFLTDDLLQRYIGDLHRVGLLQRGELGEWVVVRDLASIDLLEIYEEGGYRLPVEAAARPLEFGVPAAALLDDLGQRLRAALDVPVSAVFPADVPSTAVPTPAHAPQRDDRSPVAQNTETP
jgi:membrane protein